MRTWRPCRLLLAVALALLAHATHAFDLEALAAQLAAPAVVRGPFVQEKHLRGLDQPLTSRGHFVLAREGGLLWQLEAPLAIDYRIDTEGVARRTEAGWQRQPGSDAAARQSRLFLALLSGDSAGLARDFELALSGTADAWTLQLTPRTALLAQIFTAIDIRGAATVTAIEIVEAQGDRTRLRLPANRTDTALSAAERRDLAP